MYWYFETVDASGQERVRLHQTSASDLGPVTQPNTDGHKELELMAKWRDSASVTKCDQRKAKGLKLNSVGTCKGLQNCIDIQICKAG